jgi:glycosyltransferase involved in cell wall biosynthesis
MFLTPSYEMSNEEIPVWYKDQERVVLSEITHIITPSKFEKKQLVEIYNVNENFVSVIPRIVSHNFTRTTHSSLHSDGIMLSCISSFRRQKRVILSIDLIKQLRERGIDVQIFVVGSIQDKNEYIKFLEELNDSALFNYIHHTECMSQTELNQLYSNVDFNVSFSLCETFGRAIVESLYTGLPNIILDESGNLSDLIGKEHGAVFCNSVQNMADTIIMLSNCTKSYSDFGRQAVNFGTNFYGIESKSKLADAILK